MKSMNFISTTDVRGGKLPRACRQQSFAHQVRHPGTVDRREIKWRASSPKASLSIGSIILRSYDALARGAQAEAGKKPLTAPGKVLMSG